MFELSKFTQQILDHYRTHLELIDTIQIPFTGLASERPPPVPSSEVSEDILLFGAQVNFSNAGVFVEISSQTPKYKWNAISEDVPAQDTPVNAMAGIFSQASPILQLIQPFFLKKQARLYHQFTNSAAGPEAATRLWTWRGLRLSNPIDGFGWDYSIGFRP